LDEELGIVAPDARADLAVLDDALEVAMTFVDGQRVF
jgi:N-acetylglucosamine-6-phosphate deacetylase